MNLFQKLYSYFCKNLLDDSTIAVLCDFNGLSPDQTEVIIQSDRKDLVSVKEAIQKMMDYPDVDFLARKFMPEVSFENHLRKKIQAKDVVKATCLGDVIGSKYEFILHDYNRTKTEVLPPVSAHFTDDTMLSIATMNAILQNDKTPNFKKAYIDAYYECPSAGYGSSFATWACKNLNSEMKSENGDAGYHSMANGSAMRVSFIPAYYDNVEDVIKHAIASAMITHNHVEGVKGSIITSVCIWMALHNYTKEEIYEYCKKHYNPEKMKDFIYNKYQFDMNIPLSDISNVPHRLSLFCNYAVPYAIKCFYETNSYEECMREILSHFGDTDTICAIAGGLCFAYYGTCEFDIDIILEEHFVKI